MSTYSCIVSTKQIALISLLFYLVTNTIAIGDLNVQGITPTPSLQARAAFQTAGFISGDPDSPITCPGTSTVSKGPQYALGCCDSATCWKPASCQTNDQPTCGPNCIYSQITRCTDAASPSCAEYVLKTANDDGNPYTSFLCLPVATKIVVLVDSVSGAMKTSATSGGTSAGIGSNPTSTSQSSPGNNQGSGDSGGDGGLTLDQKIALGVGIGVGVPAIIVTTLAWWWPRRSRW